METDFFKPGTTGIKISNNKKVIHSQSDTYHTAYGSFIIDPSQNKQYIWTFEINDAHRNKGGVYIGITELSLSKYYSWFNWKRLISHHIPKGKTFNLGPYDTNIFISMRLVFHKDEGFGALYFCVDKLNTSAFQLRRDWKLAFGQIDKTTIYKMAVSLKKYRIKLTDFIALKYKTEIKTVSPNDIQPAASISNVESILLKDKSNEKRQNKRVRFVNDLEEKPTKKRKISDEMNDFDFMKALTDKIQNVYDENKDLKLENYDLKLKIKALEKSIKKYRDVMDGMMGIVGDGDEEYNDMETLGSEDMDISNDDDDGIDINDNDKENMETGKCCQLQLTEDMNKKKNDRMDDRKMLKVTGTNIINVNNKYTNAVFPSFPSGQIPMVNPFLHQMTKINGINGNLKFIPTVNLLFTP